MGIAHFIRKLILCIFDVIIIVILSILWVMIMKFNFHSNNKTFHTRLVSTLLLSFSLIIFILIFKHNVKSNYKGTIGCHLVGRFIGMLLFIPSTLIINDLMIMSLNEEEKQNQLMIVLLLIIIGLLLGSIALDVIIKRDHKIIDVILFKSMAMNNTSRLIPKENEISYELSL